MAPVLDPVRFADLPGFDEDDSLAAFLTFLRSAKALAEGLAPTRAGIAASPALRAIARAALSADIADARAARQFGTDPGTGSR